MYIPVSIGNGITAVSCVATASNTLQAGCTVRHNGIDYPSNTKIQVKLHDTIQLSANITQYAEIPVTLGTRTYRWIVDVPKQLKYLKQLSDIYISSNSYGTVSFNNQSVPFLEYGTVSNDAEILSVVDATKNAVWVFGLNGGVKRISTPEKPVSLVFAPKWSSKNTDQTIGYIVTESFVYPMIGNTEIDVEAAIRIDGNGPIVAADSDSNGIIACSATSVIRIDGNLIAKISDIGGNAIQSTYKNDIVLGTDDGRLLLLQGSLNYAKLTLIARQDGQGNIVEAPSVFQIDTNHANYTFAVDMTNRQLIAVNMVDYTTNLRQLSNVPSSVVSNEDNIYIGYYDKTGVERYSIQLDVAQTIPTDVPRLVNYTDSLVTTNLYVNASILTNEQYDTLRVEVVDLKTGEDRHSSTIVPWVRPTYIRAIDSATIMLNGEPFSSGYVAYPDVLEISVGISDIYYLSTQIDFIGDRPISAYYRTEPKLIPDKIQLNPIYDAFVRYVYEDSFVVSGVSDGFYAPVKADIPQLTFSINGGEFVQQGNVTNGDRVVVRTFLKSLVSSRDQHNMITESGVIVSEWSLLAMQLNGSSVMEESSKDSSRFDSLIFEADSSSVSETTSAPLLKSESDVSMQSMGALGSVSYQTILSSGYESDVLLTSTPSLCSIDADCFGVNSSEASLGTQSLSLSPTFFESEISGTTYTTQDREILFANAHINTYSDVSLSLIGFTEGVSTLSLNTMFFTQSLAKERTSGMVYDKSTHNYTDLSSDISVRLFSLDSEFGTSSSIFLFGETYNFLSRAYIENSSTFLDQYVEPVRSTQNTSVVESGFAEVRTNEFCSGELTARMQDSYSDIISGMLVASVATSNHMERAFEVAIRDEHVLEAIRPSVGMFALADHEVDDSKNLTTLNQVNSYVSSLNLESTSVQVKEYNGKWIFVSAPVADNALCMITPVAHSKQRRFGYAGGG